MKDASTFSKFAIGISMIMSVSLQAEAQVQPIWSYEDSVEVLEPFTSNLTAAPVSFADGRFMGLGFSSSMFSATSIAALPDTTTAPTVGGFPIWNGNYSAKSVNALASQADRVLLAVADQGFDLGEYRRELILLKSNGQPVWSRPMSGDRAKFLSNGDVIVQSGAQLSRLAAANGAPVWQQNLLELDPDTTSASVTGLSNSGAINAGSTNERFVLSAFFRASLRQSNINRNYDESIQFDAATGTIDWRVSSENTDFGYPACESIVSGGTTVTLEFSGVDTPAFFAVGRHSSTGIQRWRTALPIAADSSFGLCDVVPVNDGYLIAVVSETTAVINISATVVRAKPGYFD